MEKTIFISSPYTHGNKEVNVYLQKEAFDYLIRLGWAPFAPLWSHYQHLAFPLSYAQWIEYDLIWLDRCDAYVRLDSDLPSTGADIEEAEAKRLELPIFYGLKSVPHADNTHVPDYQI